MPIMSQIKVIIRGTDAKKQKVHYSANHSGHNDGSTTITCTGFFIAPSIVITSALPLYAFISDAWRSSLSTATQSSLLPGTSISISLPGGTDPSTTYKAGLVCIAHNQPFNAALYTLLASPSLASAGQWRVAHAAASLPLAAISHIAILQINNPKATSPYNPLLPVSLYRGVVELGASVVAIGSPFGAVDGHQRFSGYMSRGVVAATMQSHGSLPAKSDATHFPELILIDVKSLPGMEGSPVVAEQSPSSFLIDPEAVGNGSNVGRGSKAGGVVGMLLSPLKAEELSAEFHLVMPIHSILKVAYERVPNLMSQPAEPTTIGGTSNLSSSMKISHEDYLLEMNPALCSATSLTAFSGVAAITVGTGWASGFLIDTAGHILTCAHALKGRSTSTPILISLTGTQPPTWQPADVVHCFTGALDLAVLKLRGGISKELVSLPLVLSNDNNGDLHQGSPVHVVGHPVWHPKGGLGPICSAGNIAKVVYPPKSSSLALPLMLLTTSSVLSGVSGGPVINSITGKAVGMVTSNAKLHQNQIYSRLNFSIPAPLLQLAVAAVVGQNKAALAQLESLESVLRAVWSMKSVDLEQEAFLPSSRHAAFLSRLKDLSKL